MKRLLIYALCIGWAATTVGCSDDDERPVAFEVSQDTLLLDSDAGTVHVIVSAPGAWTITDIPEWVTVVPTEADGSREITIDYSENLDALREADLKVTCNGEFRYIGIGQEGKNLAAAPTNVRLYAKSTSSLTFAWDDTNAARTYTVQCADAPSEDAELMAQYTYTWTTKSTSDKWPYDYPTRMTFLGLMKGGDRSVGSARARPTISACAAAVRTTRPSGRSGFRRRPRRALHLRARSSTKGSTGPAWAAATGSIRLRVPVRRTTIRRRVFGNCNGIRP